MRHASSPITEENFTGARLALKRRGLV